MVDTVSFDETTLGTLPAGWVAGVTGQGAPRWAVATHADARGQRRVLEQSGAGRFPWCVKQDVAIADGVVTVSFKPLSGAEDAAGGLVWRWQDGDNYYVARAGALEDNVSLYYTTNGRRTTIEYVDAPVAMNEWHALRVEFAGTRIAVSLDGRRYIEARDSHIADAGAVGVWTKADSVTIFTDFTYESTRQR